jgi:apolipoprotein N-acyltransferase
MPLWKREKVQEMLRLLNKQRLGMLVAAALSGFLLACAFPMPPAMSGTEGWSAAWLALVPLMIVLAHVSPRMGGVLGLVAGMVFHLIGLAWLLALRFTWGNTPMTALAWIALAGYCSIYLGLFGYAYAFVAGRFCKRGMVARLLLMLVAPVLWVGLEYIRAILFTGFPWNVLGVSQYENAVLLQSARVFGVYGISFLIVLFNTGLALTGDRVWQEVRGRQKRRRVHLELMSALLLLALAWSGGVTTFRRTYRTMHQDGVAIRISLVQPAIAQVQKWDDEHAREIETVLAQQSEIALVSRPDVIVWPETATPGPLRTDPASIAIAGNLVSQGVSLLAGTMDVVPDLAGNILLYNAALLVGRDGQLGGRYYKRHLVPFGEYVPLTRWIPLLERFAPLGFSCTPGARGQDLLVLSGSEGDVVAGTLICFEDVFPYLARRDVRNGARLLVNITNDGWFDNTAAARQHLAHAVLRAVENEVPMVRAANSGVSAFIDQTGRFEEIPGYRAEGSRGVGTRPVLVPQGREDMTIYTRFGDWLLAIPCALGTLLLLGWILHRRRKS